MAKKILILPSWYPNIKVEHGSYFREQAQFLSQNGFDVKVLMLEVLHTQSYVYHRVKRWLKGKSFQLSQDFLLQSPNAYSYPVILQKSWSTTKKLHVLDNAYLKAFNKLNWFPDVIHVQGLYKYGLSSYLIAETFNIPLVVIGHSPFKLTNYITLYQERIKRLFAVARKVAGVSYYHIDCLSEVDSAKVIEVVWNLMDEQAFLYKPSLKSDETFVVTTVLRAVSVKDPITFFDAMLKFVQAYEESKPIEINVVGLSNLGALTKMKGIDENFISKYEGLQKQLKFHSQMDRHEIKVLHQKSTVFISTSIDEPYGIAIREAMLCGTPVIATRSGGVEDSINKDTGILVDVGDYKAIANALKDLYYHKDKFNYTYIRDYVIQQSGRKAFLKRMQDFYNLEND